MDLFEKYRKYLIVFLILVIVFGVYLIYREDKGDDKGGEDISITVDITGAVKKPGVYTFSNGDRVIDAINKAGGLTKKADLDQIAQDINQASKLDDEQKIFVPAKQKTTVSSQVASAQTSDSQTNQTIATSKINLNQASVSQLESLPGIGSVYAQRIIELRTKLGRFSSADQLLEVSGIGERTLEKILPYFSL